MIRKCLSPLAACLLVAGLHTPARAQDVTVDAETQMEELYKKMAVTLLGGKAGGEAMLVLSSPGLLFTEDFNPEGDPSDQSLLNELVDTIPQATAMFTASGAGKYSDLYSKIVQNRQATVRQELTAAEKAELNAAQALTDSNSPQKIAYDKYFDIYWSAVADADNAEQAKARNLTAMKAKVGKANSDWISNGYKNQIDAATNRIQQLTAKNGDAWWASLNNRLAAASKGDYYPATFFPTPRTWKSDDGWTYITFKYGEKADSSRTSSESIAAAVKGRHSWFSIDAAFSKNDSSAKSLMAHKDLEVSMEVKRVNVYRKWFDQDVLRNAYWTLPKTVSGGVISYGSLVRNQTAPLPGMPLYVSSIFVCRKLNLKTRIDKADRSSFEKSMSVHAKVGLGPFTLSGGYDKRDTGKDVKTAVSDVGISCDGLQIIGYLGSVPPRSPIASVR